MLRTVLIVSILLVSSLLVSGTRAGEKGEKKPEAEPIPAPKAVQPPPATIIIEPYYQRPDTREVWQHYGVNSFGRFVPRVIRTPSGDYYSRNLEPYPWASLRPREWR